MAKYKSIVKISGSVGDFVFYNLNGVPVVRQKSGFNGEDFKNSKTYDRVRENSSEFGHCSKYGKQLRAALIPYPKMCGYKYHYQDFAKLMTEIKDLDKISARGSRKVYIGLESEAGKTLLRQFQFGKIENLKNVAAFSVNVFDNSISLLNSGVVADEIVLITIKPRDKEEFAVAETQHITMVPGQKQYILEKCFEDFDGLLLYFGVILKDKKVLNMGFL